MGYQVDEYALPREWSTANLDDEFCLELGRTVAAFGTLEFTVGRAVFALCAIRLASVGCPEEVWPEFRAKMERALTSTLGTAIDLLEGELCVDSEPAFENWRDLIKELRKLKSQRDALCHASWKERSTAIYEPTFVTRKLKKAEGSVDADALRALRGDVGNLTLDVVSCVTRKGYAFPGLPGPGKLIVEPNGALS